MRRNPARKLTLLTDETIKLRFTLPIPTRKHNNLVQGMQGIPIT